MVEIVEQHPFRRESCLIIYALEMKPDSAATRTPGIAPLSRSENLSNGSRWQGAVEGLHGQLLYGWALDCERPDARVIVEVCLNDSPFGTIAADVARTDLLESFCILASDSDACHGFVADIGSQPANLQGTLSVRIANTDVALPGSFSLGESKTPPAAALNTVIGDGGLRLHGWAVDPEDPKRVLTIRAFVGERMVAETLANVTHPFIRGYVDGAHGFDLALPNSLADGKVHNVRVVDDHGRTLNGSPLTISCSVNGMAALLPEDADPLTLAVADIYERHLPRSLPLSAWPEWSTRFDAPPPAVISVLTTAILITDSAARNDPAALDRTHESIRKQEGMAVQIFAGAPFSVMLADALTAGCDVICCVRAGDTLTPHALAYALEGFSRPEATLVYTDTEQNGRPWFKPAWNPDYALASDYPIDWLLVRMDVASALSSARDQAAFAWSALSAAWSNGMHSIVHVPRVLYRMLSPLEPEERECRNAAAWQTVCAHEPSVTLESLPGVPSGLTHAARRLRAALPDSARALTVSLVIPTRDRADLLKRCIDTIRRFTSWAKLEIIVIDNGSTEAATKSYFAEIIELGVRVLPMPGPFNYADLNNRAIAQATGDIVGLVNNDIEALHEGWLEEIVAQLLRPGVGAVGAKLLWPNGMVQHGGVLLGVGNVAGHFGNLLSDDDWGDHGRNQLPQQVSACTAACLFLRRHDYLDLGGMDAHAFPVAFNDVDLCLKVRKSGKSIIWTPFAKLLHAESASRGHEDTPQKKSRARREVNELRRKWGEVLQKDPSYHPSANLDPQAHAYGGLAIPPRTREPRKGTLP
ncbi:glycosyltransferase family 2 protein [Pseudoduganella umbonata]|uniref:Glycosyltransferase n=1 Tax=Pseudoduganella umbonata TaxID=864828 RepID=A0A4P8HS39_9BURK|nr:glycosyltransferase [Pseudoduganella umbonata]MBB3225078.1 GT2 family glycosyltransferase [Pseudoduganella umbonata]QCP11452.1 glycosyltransferase [Pseudoduganella umbonata]